jgi:hypothetical protein
MRIKHRHGWAYARRGRTVVSSGNRLQNDRRDNDGAWVRDTYTLVLINGGMAVMRSGVRLSDKAPVPSTPVNRRTLQALFTPFEPIELTSSLPA